MDSLPESKRPRVEEYYCDKNKFSANSVITLHFVCDRSVICTSHPQFTHQVFEKEEIFSSATDEMFKIDIYVDVNDLTQEVYVLCPKEEVEDVRSKLVPRVPTDCHIHFSHELPENMDKVLPRSVPDVVKPFGEKVGCFIDDSKDEVYEFFLSSHKIAGTSSLVSNAEKLAVWYIETADAVDFSDDKWEVLLCYKRLPATGQPDGYSYSIAGYMTLYSFSNPFAGSKIRVCQVLVMPSVQRRGIGRQMMLCLYDYILKVRTDVVEITVEDPCEGFALMRDVVDVEWSIACLDELLSAFRFELGELTPSEESKPLPLSPDMKKLYQFLEYVQQKYVTGAFTKALCVKFSAVVKVTISQFRFALDTLCLLFIRQHENMLKSTENVEINTPNNVAIANNNSSNKENAPSSSGNTDMFKSFRAQMKRNLLKENPELKLLKDKEQIQKELSLLYNEEHQRVLKVVDNKIISKLFA